MQKFNVFDPILIRSTKYDSWTADFYNYPDSNGNYHWTITGASILDSNILPYNEETKHLHNTAEEYTKWKPKKGEPILVKDYNDKTWYIRIFVGMLDNRYICTSYFDNDYVGTTIPYDLAKPYVNTFEE